MENAQHIVLRSKIDEYIFAEKNKAFLATYDTDDKQIDYYANLAMRVFEEFKIDGDYSFDGVRTNVNVWFNNKRKQIELLRNHPYWDEEAKAIIFLQTETRNIDFNRSAHALGDLYRFVADNTDGRFKTSFLGAIQSVLFDMNGNQPPIVTQSMLDKISERLEGFSTLPKQIRNCLSIGCRITKLVRKTFEFMELESGKIINTTTYRRGSESFDRLYAQFSDCLSELTVEKITLLSVHFNDFMLMSNGNSWLSCHFINSHNIFHEHTGQSVHGEYKQGCLSYALDVPSMIFYTLPATYDGEEYYRCPKLSRMCCQYENGVLITGKCYPNNEDSLVTRYRNILQQVLSQCGRFPNLWTFSKNTDRISTFAKTASGAAHYPDYTYSRQKPTVSLCRNITLDLDNPMEIGHEAYCLYCSNTIDTDRRSWLQCRKHEVKMICSVCGKRIDRLHDICGAKYCDDCVFFCDWHGRYEPITDRYNSETICTAASIERDSASYLEDVGLTIVKTEYYNIDDYVLMAENVGVCNFGTSDAMDRHYPNKIVKITSTSGFGYKVSKLREDNSDFTWQWSKNCFVGKIIGATDAHIGKTIEEIRRELTHEA